MSNIGSVYRAIIDDVIRSVQPDFEEQGVDVGVLRILKQSWEAKMAEKRVVSQFPFAGSEHGGAAATPGSAEAQDNDTNAQFAAASLASLASLAPMGPTGGNEEVASMPVSPLVKRSDSVPPMSPNSSTSNVGAQEESGSAGITNSPNGNGDANASAEYPAGSSQPMGRKARRLNNNGQVESTGADQDEYDEDEEEEEQADDDAINSDLDDTDEDDAGSEGDNAEVQNFILCQYEKVARTKNKWKCVLKDGVMTMDGCDYVFHRATGDFEW